MSVKPVRLYGESVLREKCAPVEFEPGTPVKINPVGLEIARDLMDTCKAWHAFGLSAPQIGCVNRMIAINDINPKGEKRAYSETLGGSIICINPSLELSGERQVAREACLSFPGAIVDVSRHAQADVTLMSLNLETGEAVMVYVEATGLLARIFQHEIDHLDGKLIVDRARSLNRACFKNTGGTRMPEEGRGPG